MKRIYILLVLLIPMLNMELVFAITSLQYSAQKSINIVKKLIKKAEEVLSLSPSEKIQLSAHLNSLSFTDPKNAKILMSTVQEYDLLPTEKKDMNLINKATGKNPTVEDEVLGLKKMSSEFKNDLENAFDISPEEGATTILANRNVCNNLTADNVNTCHRIIDKTQENLYNDGKYNPFNSVTENVNNISIEELNKKTGDVFQKNFSFDFKPMTIEQKKERQEGESKIKTIINYLTNFNLDNISPMSLVQKMGVGGYFNKAKTLEEKYDDYKKFEQYASRIEKNLIENLLKTKFDSLIKIVTNDLLHYTKEYEKKQSGLYKSEVYKTLSQWINDINQYSSQNKVLNLEAALLKDADHFVLNYTQPLDTNFTNVQDVIKKYKNVTEYADFEKNENIVEFGKKFAKYFFGLDDINNVQQCNSYSIQGLIQALSKYKEFLDQNNENDKSQSYDDLIKRFIKALHDLLTSFQEYLPENVFNACRDVMDLNK